jgi:hypothetical protein
VVKIFLTPDVCYYTSVPLLEHLAHSNWARQNEFRLISLCMHRPANVANVSEPTPRYTAVWHYDVRAPDWEQMPLGTAGQVQNALTNWRKDFFYPTIVTAYRYGPWTRFGVVVERHAAPSHVVLNLKVGHASLFSAIAHVNRERIAWLASYGTDYGTDTISSSARFAAVVRETPLLHAGPGGTFPVNQTRPAPWGIWFGRGELDGDLGALSRGFVQPDNIAIWYNPGGWPYPTRAHVALASGEEWAPFQRAWDLDLRLDELPKTMKARASSGFVPISLQGDDGVGVEPHLDNQFTQEWSWKPKQRFSVVYARAGWDMERKLAIRRVTASGFAPADSAPAGVFADLEEHIVEEILKPTQARAAQVAVAYQGRLVYAGAFTWADQPLYPPTTLTQRMRIASISKAVTCMAMWALLDDRPEIDIWDAEKWSIAKLMKRDFKDQRFYSRAVGHLMAHLAYSLPDVDKTPPGTPNSGEALNQFNIAEWKKQVNPAWKNKTGVDLRPEDYIDFIAADPLHYKGGFFTQWYADKPGVQYITVVSNGGATSSVETAGPYSIYNGLDSVYLAEIMRVQQSMLPKPPLSTSYEGFVQERLFKRLNIKGADGALLVSGQALAKSSQEVLYHADKPGFNFSVQKESSGELTPDQYDPGFESLSNGGWAMSAVEVVRLFSALDLGRGSAVPKNPLFNDYTRARYVLEDDTVAFNDNGSGRRGLAFYHPRYFGETFDWHNGEVLGCSAVAFREHSTGLTIALLVNQDDVAYSERRLITRARSQFASWPTTDLFQFFGMAFPP